MENETQGAINLPKILYHLAAGSLLVGLGQGAQFALLPLVVGLTRLSPATIGAIVGLSTLMGILGALLWGRIADSYGPKRAALWAMAVYGLAQIGLLLSLIAARDEVLAGAGLAGAILAGRLLHGLSVAGIHPVLQSWASRLTGAADRLRGLARLSAGLNIGRLIGPTLAAAAIWHPLLPFILIAFLAFPGLLVLAALPSVNVIPVASPAAPLACRPRRFDWSPVSGFLLTLMVGQIYGILGLYLQAAASLSDGEATAVMGGILSAAALAGLGVQILVIPRLKLDEKRHHGVIAAFASILIVILGALAPILADGIGGGIVSACLLSVGATLLAALMTARVSLRAALGRLGRAAGRQSAAQTAGYAAGAALGGVLFQLLATAPFWCAAVVGLFLLASEHMDQRGNLEDAAGV